MPLPARSYRRSNCLLVSCFTGKAVVPYVNILTTLNRTNFEFCVTSAFSSREGSLRHYCPIF